ncbi:hypothetical protein A8709_09600 [Paenibacillus pectinilyticus]|uniref:MFS transporter n=2 Tax=Paenibacillus pectinilyticus TaxID=512399 RepID=A0A1C1A5M5_9BACL|nr:hypothetical protein A8709_09600 [Paenibacillus pectinilyticus]
MLLIILTLNACANSLSSIFINVYLYKLSGSLYQVFLFHLISYTIWIPVYIGAGILSKNLDRRLGLLLGNVFHFIFYLVLTLYGDSMGSSIVYTGLLFGVGSSLFWFTVNLLVVDYTHAANRDWFNGLNGIFTSLSQMIGPFLAGWIIVRYPGFQGYHTIFYCTFGLFIASMGCTLMLPRNAQKGRFSWRKVRDIHRVRTWRWLTYSFTSLHFRDDVLGIFLWIWMYMTTKNEGVLGNYSLLLTLLATTAYYWMGRHGGQGSRMRYMFLGGVGLSAGLLLLMGVVNTWTLLLYTVLAGLAGPLFQVPFSTVFINSISQFDNDGEYRVELLVAREMAISVGRILSISCLVLLVYWFPLSKLIMNSYLLVLIIAGLLPIWFVSRLGK